MREEYDPASVNVIGAAVQWLDHLLLGSVATMIATVAIASVGFLLLTGRIDVRRGAQVIFGCFIIFGASTIAAGLMTAAAGTQPVHESLPAIAPPPVPASATAQAATPYDPYAGAALPTRR